MIHIDVGTDTYGRVKSVSGTPIVTSFFMCNGLPVYPLRSYYFVGAGPTESSGIPVLAGTQSTAIVGIPLASVDVASVVMAYVRGLCGALVVLGSIVIVFGIMVRNGNPPNASLMAAVRVILTLFVIGAVGGLLTYAIPLTPPASETFGDSARYCCASLPIRRVCHQKRVNLLPSSRTFVTCRRMNRGSN